MKIVTTFLLVLLLATLGGAGYFYVKVHEPMAGDLAALRSEQPQFEKTSRELKSRKDREAQETAWLAPAVDALRKGLAAAGIPPDKAEVAVAGGRIYVNIAEAVLFTPKSVTFGKDSKPALDGLADMLKPLKNLEFVVGNVTEPAPAQGKGRKRIPAKDARSLAAARSLELVKYLEKKGVASEALVAASYPTRIPEQGFKIKADKTMIVISVPASATQAPAAASFAAPAAKTETKPAPATQSTGTKAPAPSQPKPVPIPITPAPKKVQ